MQLDQVKAIITGGASGLGHAVAQHLVAHGGQVALFDVNGEKGTAAASTLGDAARFYRTDVTSEENVATNAAAAHAAMGGLNVVMTPVNPNLELRRPNLPLHASRGAAAPSRNDAVSLVMPDGGT
jgi:NAD(P)-dependent dehydrogenase (short-subunit alcohol dehydrogenase family)